MAKGDDAAYEYLSIPKYFADLFNAKFFQGRQVVDYRELEEADGRSPLEGETTCFRDIKKRLKNGTQLIIMAIENQANVDYEMPYRIMLYDCAEYGRQIRELHQKKANERTHLGKKRNRLKEKMDSNDRLWPVYTICFYHGTDTWNGPRSLKDMMEFGENWEQWENLFSDYKMLVVSAEDARLAGRCKTQLKQFLQVLNARGNKEKMKRLLKDKSLYHLDAATSKAIAVLADVPNFLKDQEKYRNEAEDEEGSGFNMCIAIREMMEEAREEGLNRGISRNMVSNIENLINNLKLDLTAACSALGTTVEEYEHAKQVVRETQ